MARRRATYRHGERRTYCALGCRCVRCRAANAKASRHYRAIARRRQRALQGALTLDLTA
ncbi:MAG TPA: hypothetical protein VMH24_08440 [Candidatus Sulfotelmatobacter sp.]|nr:hypothetical protein [Candidatus Sulfotelmatobacter sp.]